MSFHVRATARASYGIGLIGATTLLLTTLAAPAAAQDDPVVLEVTATEAVTGAPGEELRVETGVVNTGSADLVGGTVDFEVPDGVTVTGAVGQEFVDGTERPDEGCALVTPQRVECHTDATLAAGDDNAAAFLVTVDEGATGELGTATVTVAGDNGGEGSAQTTITSSAAPEGDVVLEAAFDGGILAPPGAEVELSATTTNTGTADMVGGTVDFEVPDGVTITGAVGQEFVDGTERPDEGCALVTPQRVECHTNSTLAVGDTAEATFLLQLPDDVYDTLLGNAVLHVAGDNGGEDTVETDISVGPPAQAWLNVSATPEVEGAPGEVLQIGTDVMNVGGEDVVGADVDFEVPEGATVVGIVGQEIVDGTERPDEGCALVTPQRLECHTNATLVAYDGVSEATVEIRIDDDAPAGELGVATLRIEGDNAGSGGAETVVTVVDDGSGDDGAENGGAESGDDGGAESGTESGGDGDDLPDTGAGSTTLALVTAGMLLLGGAAIALRSRRA